jgi:hypothetical protein
VVRADDLRPPIEERLPRPACPPDVASELCDLHEDPAVDARRRGGSREVLVFRRCVSGRRESDDEEKSG